MNISIRIYTFSTNSTGQRVDLCLGMEYITASLYFVQLLTAEYSFRA